MRTLQRRLEMLRSSFVTTPVVTLADDALDLHAKLEFSNPNGSAKDRSAFWILKQAVERGDITPATMVVESSSGNFAISMASFCRSLGLSFVPVIDPNCNSSTESYLHTLCDRVEKVTEPDGVGGHLRTRLRRVEELRAELPGAYWPNQYVNPDGMTAHYRLTGGELCRRFRRIDFLFVGVSTGGTIAGLSARVKESYPGATVVAVDADGSAIFGATGPPRRIPGLGSGIVPPLCDRALIDDVVIVPEADAVAGCHALFHRHGLFAGGSTGSVYSAIGRYFRERPALTAGGARPTVVFLCADRGTAYLDTVYDPAWVARHYPQNLSVPDVPAMAGWKEPV